MQYPELRDELVALLEEDQLEVREFSKSYQMDPQPSDLDERRARLTRRSRTRSERMIEILAAIQLPTVDTIGAEGLEAMSVLALHSQETIMQKVCDAFVRARATHPQKIMSEYLPALIDRLRILNDQPQIFGTQWLLGSNGKVFLYPVEDFSQMNSKRKEYGLPKARRPRDLTYGTPKGPLPPYTVETDQKMPTKEEYDDFVREIRD